MTTRTPRVARPGARVRAAGFRLEQLGPGQRRILERALRPDQIADLSPVERARLETLLGAFIDVLTDTAGAEALPARDIVRILRKPHRLNVEVVKVHAVASAAFELRHEELVAGGAARSSFGSRGASAPSAVQQSRRLSGLPWRRPLATPLAGAKSRAAAFRLEQLDPQRLRVIERAIAPARISDLAPLDRAELEAHLGAYIDVLTEGTGPGSIELHDLSRILKRPSRLRVATRKVQALSKVVFEQRHEELVAAGALARPGGSGAPGETLAGMLDLETLPAAHLAAVGRHFLRRGTRRLSSRERAHLEAHLQVFLAHSEPGREPAAAAPRRLVELLSTPGGGSDYEELRFRAATLSASWPPRRSIDWTRVPGTRAARLAGEVRKLSKAVAARFLAARAVSRHWLVGVAKGEIKLPDIVALAFSLPLFVVLERTLVAPDASERWYRRSEPLLWQWLDAASPLRVVVAVAITFLVAWRVPWRSFDAESLRWLRPLATAAALLLAVVTCLTPPNPYFGRAFAIDRAILLGCGALTWVSPAALAPLVITWSLFEQQRRFPFSGFELLPALPLLWLLVAILTIAGWRVLARVDGRVAVALAAMPVLSSFFFSGLRLLRLGPDAWTWALEERPGNLLASSWQHGWLSRLDESSILMARRLLNAGAPALLLPLVALLALSPLTFGHRRFAKVVFAGLLAAQLGLFVLTGFAWWGWWLLTGLLAAATVTREAEARWLFTPRMAFGVLAGVALAPWLLQPKVLAWWSTPYNNRLLVEAVDEQGRTYPTTGWYGPYDAPFLLQRLYGVQAEPRLVDTHGMTSHYGLFRLLARLSAQDGREVDRLASALGNPQPEDVARARRRLDRLLRKAAANAQSNEHWPWRTPGLRWLRAFNTNRQASAAPIRALRLRVEESLVDDDRLVVFRSRVVYELKVEDDSGSAPSPPRQATLSR